jgi:phosphate uptake regulator
LIDPFALNQRREKMKNVLFGLLICAALVGCGGETAESTIDEMEDGVENVQDSMGDMIDTVDGESALEDAAEDVDGESALEDAAEDVDGMMNDAKDAVESAADEAEESAEELKKKMESMGN